MLFIIDSSLFAHFDSVGFTRAIILTCHLLFLTVPQSSPQRCRRKLNMRMKSFSLDTPEPPKPAVTLDESTKRKSNSYTNNAFGRSEYIYKTRSFLFNNFFLRNTANHSIYCFDYFHDWFKRFKTVSNLKRLFRNIEV